MAVTAALTDAATAVTAALWQLPAETTQEPLQFKMTRNYRAREGHLSKPIIEHLDQSQ